MIVAKRSAIFVLALMLGCKGKPQKSSDEYVVGPAECAADVPRHVTSAVRHDDELWVLDYKTDLLSGDDLARAADLRVRNHYAVQARLYAIAADKLRGSRRLGGLLYQFVRHDITVPLRMQGDTLAVWTAWLAGLPTLPAAMSREVRS